MSGKKSDETGDSLSELFEILSHAYRRRILVSLAQHNPQDEDDVTSASITDEGDDDAPEHLKLQLYHKHLPKLADAGFVDWDHESGLITRGPRFDEMEPLLRLMNNHQDELPEDWP